MSKAEKTSPQAAPVAPLTASGDATAREKTSGRVAFDARGNAIWEWRTGDRQYAREVSTTLVERLSVSDLKIATTAIVQALKGGKPAKDGKAVDPSAPRGRVEPSHSYNPYNLSAAEVARSNPSKRLKPKSVVTRMVVRRPRKGLLQRLRGMFGLD